MWDYGENGIFENRITNLTEKISVFCAQYITVKYIYIYGRIFLHAVLNYFDVKRFITHII